MPFCSDATGGLQVSAMACGPEAMLAKLVGGPVGTGKSRHNIIILFTCIRSCVRKPPQELPNGTIADYLHTYVSLAHHIDTFMNIQ